jgi:hypothetical protein
MPHAFSLVTRTPDFAKVAGKLEVKTSHLTRAARVTPRWEGEAPSALAYVPGVRDTLSRSLMLAMLCSVARN